MKQKIVRLTESQLANVIAKTIAREKLDEEIKDSEKTLNEDMSDGMQGALAVATAGGLTISLAVKQIISAYKEIKSQSPEMSSGQAVKMALSKVASSLSNVR